MIGGFSFAVRINDTVTFVEDGLDEDIEFGDEISSEGEGDPVDNVSYLSVDYYNALLRFFGQFCPLPFVSVLNVKTFILVT